jgi:hypothetical protein
MQVICHRRNTINELLSTNNLYGIEIDIRSYGKNLILHHEPFVQGCIFERWLNNYKHKTLILNVKEEGLEERVLTLMKKYDIEDYFFLDQSFPFLVKTACAGESRCAVRVSEYESIDTALSLSGKIEWAWVDYFSRFPLQKNDVVRLNEAKFKLCIVSPELQGYEPSLYIPSLRNHLLHQNIHVHAVCTKHPELWD